MSNSAGSSRLIWVIRHGERADNIDQNWRKNGSLPRGQWDDPPLSARGLIQASEVGQKLSAESAKIEFILCSPFTRCLQTAQQILAKLAQNGQFPKMLIEPGFCESLNACQSPPGFLGIDEIREIYPNLPILSNYKQFFPPENLPKNECTNFCCFRRVIGTLKYVLGELNGNLVVVSHGSPISAIHFAMTGQLDYMGQCTISKYQINEGKIDGQNAQFSLFLPIPGKSIRISALPKMKDQWRWKKNLSKIEGNGEEKVEEMEKSGRRNTMPIRSGKFIWKKNAEKDGHLAICLTRLVEAMGIRAELGFTGDCLAAGDSGHLSDKQNLHDILCI